MLKAQGGLELEVLKEATRAGTAAPYGQGGWVREVQAWGAQVCCKSSPGVLSQAVHRASHDTPGRGPPARQGSVPLGHHSEPCPEWCVR